MPMPSPIPIPMPMPIPLPIPVALPNPTPRPRAEATIAGMTQLPDLPPLPILHRGHNLVVIDKPAGLAVEADGADSVLKRLARQLAPPGGRAWPRAAHRLDTQTSGCLAVALDARAEAALRRLFTEGAVDKEYLALVLGQPPDAQRYDTPYGPDPRDRRRFTTRLSTPRRARLRFLVEERRAECALVRVWLETGRTHQIRVQLADAGYPVLGDATYGSAASLALAARLGLSRHALHAARLALPDPEGGAPLDCRAPLPEDLALALGLSGSLA
jgi:23S rRNA pseudouridine1911/1915/1917 synthase